MKELVEYLARGLAERPEEIRVRAGRDEKGLLLRLTAAPEDQSRLIGKDGRTVRAMRTLLAAAAAKSGIRCHLKIVGEDEEDASPEGDSPSEDDEPAEGHD